MPTRRTAIYCRISQDREGAGLGVDRQRRDCEQLAHRLGWTIVAVHTDNDISASTGKARPGYRALLADIESGRINAVVCWHTDRLHRLPRELESYIDLAEKHKVVTQAVKAGEIDLATPSGRAIARTLGAWARFEAEHKGERTKRAQLQAAESGRWIGGRLPIGWTQRNTGRMVLDPAPARRIRKAMTDVLAGVSLGSIVTRWNAEGFATATGRAWTYASLRQVLTRARNAGLVEYDGHIIAATGWPPLVSEDIWRALCTLLDDPSRRRSQSNRVRWLLAGVAVCGAAGCGAPLRSGTATSRNGHRTVYRCTRRGGGHVARAVADVNDLVHQVLRDRLAQHDVVDLLADTDRDDLTDVRAEATAQRKRLDEVADAFASGDIDAAQLSRITRRCRDRLNELERVLAASHRGTVLDGLIGAPDPVRVWDELDLDRQRAVIRELVDIVVLPVPSGKSQRDFDPELIRFDWRTAR